MIRDTQIIPDDGAGRIYTTTGFGYEKRKYVREDAATAPVSAQAREALEAGARLCDNVPSTRHGEYARVLRSLSVGGVNRTTIRIEVLRALFEYATADKQFPIDEPFNTYLRETMAALAAPVSA